MWTKKIKNQQQKIDNYKTLPSNRTNQRTGNADILGKKDSKSTKKTVREKEMNP